MRRLKVNAKLIVRKVPRLETLEKVGLAIVGLVIVPSCLLLLVDVFINGAQL